MRAPRRATPSIRSSEHAGPDVVTLLRYELKQARGQAAIAFAVEQRYLRLLKCLLARTPHGTVNISDAEYEVAADLRMGVAPNGDHGGALLIVKRAGESFGVGEAFPDMDRRVADRTG